MIQRSECQYESYRVVDSAFQVWKKRDAPENAPRTVRVSYRCLPEWAEPDEDGTYGESDYVTISEWVCPEHTGFARHKFVKWWMQRALPETPLALSATDVCEFNFMGLLRRVTALTVKRFPGKPYPEIVSYRFGDYPDSSPFNAKRADEEFDEDDLPF